MSDNNDKVKCELCGEMTPHIEHHLKKAHPDVSIAEYRERFPDAPLMSQKMAQLIAEKQREGVERQAAAQKMMAKIIPFSPPGSVERTPMHEVFEMPLDDTMRTLPKRGQQQGDPIMVEVLVGQSSVDEEAIPEIDDGYVFRADEMKDAVMAIQLNIPLLAWGYHGTGKTTLIEQICARTRRPLVRVQHTDTTEEAHITGQMAVRNGGTEFDYGPLAEAMQRGWLYLADEYDFAHPAVIAVYQAVLEGKPLYIKEAPPHQRLVKPHPNFRFVATGNTNGSGDDTGLYAGTKIGNAAAYSRFGVTIQVNYPDEEVEKNILKGRLSVRDDIASKMVDFATRIRAQYANGELSLPISPRELITATKIGLIKSGQFRKGLDLAYINRLDNTQAEAARQCAQRVFN